MSRSISNRHAWGTCPQYRGLLINSEQGPYTPTRLYYHMPNLRTTVSAIGMRSSATLYEEKTNRVDLGRYNSHG